MSVRGRREAHTGLLKKATRRRVPCALHICFLLSPLSVSLSFCHSLAPTARAISPRAARRFRDSLNAPDVASLVRLARGAHLAPRHSRHAKKFNGGGGGDGNDGDDDDDSDVASHTPWRSHGLICLAPASRAAPYGASAIIGELRCLFGGASADQSRLAARSSPVLAFVSLPPRGMILRARSHRPRKLFQLYVYTYIIGNSPARKRA